MTSDAGTHTSELSDLREAFQVFTSASRKLEQSYAQLKEHTEELKQELREKNARLEASLEEKERLESFLQGTLQNLPVGILVTGPSGSVRLANQKAAEILGQGEDQLMGKMYAEFEVLKDIPLGFGVSREKKVGRSVYTCSVSSLNGSPEDNTGWVVMIEDISEISRLKALSERQKRLSSMGEMAARIAHEIRNPLGSMELNATMLLEELQGNDNLYELACRLSTGVRTVSSTLSNLLHFAKGTAAPLWERFDLSRLVSEAVDLASPLLREKNIPIGGNYKAKDISLTGDRILLRQAILNLVLNAIDAMEPGGQLQISINLEEGEQEAWSHCPVIKIFVEDNGRGIPEADIDRIFDPFFTTRHSGTGLGLAIVYNIIESHKGIIEVDSRQGEGSCFILSLPCRPEEAYGHAADSCS